MASHFVTIKLPIASLPSSLPQPTPSRSAGPPPRTPPRALASTRARIRRPRSTPENTLLATSVCADDLERVLEEEFVDIYGTNFNLGGLSSLPFAGNTGWEGMSAHVPNNGYPPCGHHQGGTDRLGRAAITDGSADINPRIQQFSNFQQGAVQELILPFGKRLTRAEDRMRKLPYALYDSQEVMVTDIVNTGKGSIKKGLAVLGDIQINTSPDTLDYFHPLRLDYFDENGNFVENMLPYLR
ncbi:hypothetical protein ACHAWF_007235 [Thalassiosira exigua]